MAARLRKVPFVTESFPTSGQFDAVAVISVEETGSNKGTWPIRSKNINGVMRTETMVEVQ